MNPILIIARLILPLIILGHPLFGGAISLYLDGTDWHTKNLLGIAPFGDYQMIDKLLDMLYLFFFFVVSLYLKNKLVRMFLIVLFVYRMIGITLFELTDMRMFLFIFPNIFENYFYFYYVIKFIARYEPKLSERMIMLTLILMAVPKVLHEYSTHIIQKPIVMKFGEMTFSYDGINSQIMYVVILSLIFGIYYRVTKVRKRIK